MATNHPLVVGLLALSVDAATCLAQQPKSDDALPAGAVARLGSARLHHAGVQHLVFAPDGKRVASVGRAGAFDGTVRVWDVKTGTLYRTFPTGKLLGYSPSWSPLGFSPDSRYLAHAGTDRTLRVWDVQADRQLFRRERDFVCAVAFAPDSKSLAIVTGDRVRILDAESGDQQRELEGCKYLQQVAFSADGRTITAIGHEKPDRRVTCVYGWETATGQKTNDRFLDFATPFASKLSPRGTHLTIPDSKRALHIWETATGKKIAQTNEDCYPAQIAFSGDGRLITASSRDGKLNIWETATAKLIQRLDVAAGAIQKVALAHDGKLAAIVNDEDNTLRFWDLTKGKELHFLPGYRGGRVAAVFTADGKSVLIANHDGRHSTPTGPGYWSLRRWDFGAGTEIDLKPRTRSDVEVRRAAFSPEARFLATADGAGLLNVIEAATGKRVSAGQLATQTITIKTGSDVKRHESLAVESLVFSPDGRLLAAPSRGKIGVYETTSGKLLRELPRPAESFAKCCFFPDCKSLLIGEGATGAALSRIDAETGAEIANFAGATGVSYALAVSLKGDRVARLSRQLMEMYDAMTGGLRWKTTLDEASFTLAFSPDDAVLATGGRDGAVRLWNAATGQPLQTWTGHNGEVSSLAFSRDGRLLVSCGGTMVLVWRTPGKQ